MQCLFFPKLSLRVLVKNFCTYKSKKWPKQIFSAIQPTGEAHLGNYLGALKKWVDLQSSEKNPIFAIADLHSITLPQDPKQLNDNIFLMAATLLACGIDTNKSILFQQSAVPQHLELCWILTSMSTMARLTHLPQYKEKSERIKNIPVGIFIYPILQAADILLYRSTHVPVGEDQGPHISLTNDIAHLFNNCFGESFPMVNIILDSSAARIKSLVNPLKKMSKSDINKKATITLLDDPDEILKKCKKAITDFTSEITFEPEKRPGVANLILIHSNLTGKTPEDIVSENKNLNTGEYKQILAEIIIEHLKPIRQKILEYLNSREFLISELTEGSEKAKEKAEKTIKEIKSKIGFDLNHLINSSSKNHLERIYVMQQ